MTEHDRHSLTEAEKRLVAKLVEKRTRAETKFPLIFILLVTFGVVSTLQGFGRLIDRIPLFSNNPWILLVVGLLTLLTTGTLYKKLN